MKRPDAPLCINCKYCEQNGFLFVCFMIDVGLYGMVYWYRKEKSKTYPNVPKKSEECDLFVPLIPDQYFADF